MKNLYLLLLSVCLTFVAHSHQFITEILVEESSGQYPTNNQYNTIQSYSLNEDEILEAYDEPIYSVSDRIKLETLKQVIPTTETIEVTTCENTRTRKSVQKTCGQFDHFNAARAAAIKTCHSLNNNNPGLYPSGLIPRFSGPGTFVSLDKATVDHHSIYHVSHGVQFSCVEVLLFTE